jgi:hypothetical protein
MNSKQPHASREKIVEVEGLDLDQKLKFLETKYLKAIEEYRFEDARQTVELFCEIKEEAYIAFIKKQLPIICAITAIQVSTIFLYPKWCRYRHSISPYNAEQLMMRKRVLNVQFEPPFKPFEPRITSKFFQAIAIYNIPRLIYEHYQSRRN